MQNQVIEAEVVSLSAQSEKSSEIAKREENSLTWLQPSEKFALEYFQRNFQKGGSSTYAIAPSVQANLFALYLNGRTLEEIRKLNHPAFSLGQIVAAAVEGDWYNQKKDYQSGLMLAAKERLQQIGCESVNFLADSLAAAHKQHGEALQKYMVSGNPSDLGAFAIGGIRQYKEVLELLLRATGQDKTSNLNVKGSIEHSVAGEASSVVSTSSGPKGLLQLAAEKKVKEIQLAAEKKGKEK
jgi:hypothetical protein